jgi:hypothetical protein
MVGCQALADHQCRVLYTFDFCPNPDRIVNESSLFESTLAVVEPPQHEENLT